MIMEERNKPHTLLIMESLKNRSSLYRKNAKYYSSLKKGWEGEKLFDTMLEQIDGDYIILKDLLFKVNGTVFQIDTILIANGTLYLYEVKNYEGEYLMDKNRLIQYATKKEILNPTIQLERSQVLLRQLLDAYEKNINIEAYVVFVNCHFTLYQISPDQCPFLLPTMIDEHLEMIARKRNNLTKRHRDWAAYLNSERMESTPYLDLPDYSYASLNKGILCFQCHSRIEQLTGRLVVCPVCQYKETAPVSVKRHIEEFCRLFPQEKVTLSAIREWCGKVPSRYTIRLGIKEVKSRSVTGP